MPSEKLMIYLCSGTVKAGVKKLSFRVASYLETLGVATISTLEELGRQKKIQSTSSLRLMFINDCKGGCITVLTQGLRHEEYIHLDLSAYRSAADFNISDFIQSHLAPLLKEKWNMEPFAHAERTNS